MALCDDAFFIEEIADCGHIAVAGRKFCCLACADDWRHQNGALIEAGAPFHLSVRENSPHGSSCGSFIPPAQTVTLEAFKLLKHLSIPKKQRPGILECRVLT